MRLRDRQKQYKDFKKQMAGALAIILLLGSYGAIYKLGRTRGAKDAVEVCRADYYQGMVRCWKQEDAITVRLHQAQKDARHWRAQAKALRQLVVHCNDEAPNG